MYLQNYGWIFTCNKTFNGEYLKRRSSVYTKGAIVENPSGFMFFGIGLVLYKKSHSAGYKNQSTDLYIIYQKPNSQGITGDIQL